MAKKKVIKTGRRRKTPVRNSARKTVGGRKGAGSRTKGRPDRMQAARELLGRIRALRSPNARVRGAAFIGLPHPDDIRKPVSLLLEACVDSVPGSMDLTRELYRESVKLVVCGREGEEPAQIVAACIAQLLGPAVVIMGLE